METLFGKCNSGMKSPMKMIKIVIVFVGMTTMACSDKPSSVSNDNSTTSAPPASGIVEKYPGHSPSGFIGDRRIRPGHYIQMDVLAATRNFILQRTEFGNNVVRILMTSPSGIQRDSCRIVDISFITKKISIKLRRFLAGPSYLLSP